MFSATVRLWECTGAVGLPYAQIAHHQGTLQVLGMTVIEPFLWAALAAHELCCAGLAKLSDMPWALPGETESPAIDRQQAY